MPPPLPSRRIATHLAACATGLALVVGLAHRRPVEAVRDASSLPSSHADGSRVRENRQPGLHSPAELKRMLEESDEMELTGEERYALGMKLHEEWKSLDPEGYLLWRDGQLWAPGGEPTIRLATEHPEFIYHHALETGDLGLLLSLADKNPAAAMSLLKSDGLLDDDRLVRGIFEAGIKGDPGFASHIEEISSPELRTSALNILDYTLANTGQAAALVALWKAYPEVVDAEAIGGAASLLDESKNPYWEQLLPGEGWGGAAHDPLSTLKFLTRLQETYLPDATPEDRLTIFKDADLFPDLEASQLPGIQDLANGQPTPEALEILARGWLSQQSRDRSLLESNPDPAFRDIAIKVMLETDDLPFAPFDNDSQKNGAVHRLLSEVTDDALRAELEDKYSPPENEKPAEDPPAGQ